jgi:hypothetical protein
VQGEEADLYDGVIELTRALDILCPLIFPTKPVARATP